MIIELGIFGLFVFLAVVFLFVQSSFSHISSAKSKDSRIMTAAALCGITAALAQGLTDYIWYNYRVFFIFWAVIGLTAALRRCDTLETDYITRKDKQDQHAAHIDIPLYN